MIEEEYSVDLGWKEPGFHRPLTGILHNLIYIFVAAGFGILISIWLIPNVVYPFPQAVGFESITMQFFVVYFTILDLGIGAAIQRFVAAEKVTDPRKSLQYIQFFIWYQMFSGLIQISIIAIWVIYFLPSTDIAYAAWFFLIYSTIQYPGMLSIFRGSLEAFQRFDKANIIGFIQIQIFENILRIIFILIGRKLGSMNPAIGELMGATMGSLIGRYLKDFFSALLAGYWLHPILKEIDPKYGLRALFFVEFDKGVVKKCLIFGIKVLIPGLIAPIGNFIAVTFQLLWLLNYSSIIGLYAVGEMLAHLVSTFAFPGIASTISEAYSNGKYQLTKEYITQFFRWTSIISGFMIGLLFSGSYLIGLIAGGNFYLVTPIIKHFLFWKLFQAFSGIVDNMFVGCGKPGYNIILIGAEQITRNLILYIMLVPFPSSWYALVYSVGAGWFIKWALGLYIFHKKVLRVYLNYWQTFGATLIAIIVEAFVVDLFIQFIFPLLSIVIGETVAAIILMVLGIFVGPFIIFFPIYSLAGGFDEQSLKTLEKARIMSGPSKPLITFVKTLSVKFASISPLHNKFPTQIEGVKQEIKELMKTQEESKKLQEI